METPSLVVRQGGLTRHSIQKPTLLNMPWEILNHIRKELPTSSRIVFALACKYTFHTFHPTGTLPWLSNPERRAIIRLIVKDQTDYWACMLCPRLIRWDPSQPYLAKQQHTRQHTSKCPPKCPHFSERERRQIFVNWEESEPCSLDWFWLNRDWFGRDS